MMLNATAVVSAELLESVESRERAYVPVAKTPVDLAKEMGTDEVYKKREEMEAAVAKNEAEVRQLAAAMAVLGAELVGSDTFARAGELGPLIMAGARPFSELVELFRSGYRRVQAARTLQAAVRCCIRRRLGPNRWNWVGVDMWQQCGASELGLQRLRHGACRAWEVHAATGRCATPLKLWLASDPAARRCRPFLLCVPKVQRTLLAIRMRRGADAAIMVSVNRARAHAARRIQWWFQLWQLRRLLIRHAAGQAQLEAWQEAQAQLEAWQEARKALRRAARARARAGGIGAGSSAGRIEAPPREATARAAVAVGEGRVAPGQAGGRRSSEGRHRWAGAALFVAAALWGLVAIRPALVLSPAAVHHLPRPPGVRFGGSGGGPSAVDLRLRWLWMQASPAAVLAVVQGAARGGSGRGGQAGVGDSREHRDGRTLDGQSVRLVSQPAALREILRLRDGAYGLPRPPEWWLRDYGFRQARGGSAEAGYGDERGLVVVRWLMGVLIAGELGGLCQRVSRWPGHAALPRGWWKRAFGLRQPECGASRVRPGGARAAIRTFRGTVNYGFALGLASVEAMQYGLYDGDEDPDE